MTTLSVQLSRAVARGRSAGVVPASRAALLHVLLRKRAAAHVRGANELEALLRNQIRWALPVLPGEATGG